MTRATGGEPRQELIAFRVGQQEFCVDIMAVREIRGWSAATALPHAPDYVRGVINLRGAVLPVIDLSARLGLGAVEPTPRHVIMVAAVDGQTVGLLVDAVLDILAPCDAAIQPPPEVGSQAVRNVLRGIVVDEGRMISVIAIDEVLPQLPAEAA